MILERRGRAMTSDSRVIDGDLRKIRCRECDLVRNGIPIEGGLLSSHYGEEYALAARAAVAEPLYYTSDGAIPRSKGIFDWLLAGLAELDKPVAGRVLEVGAGEGSVMKRFVAAFPEAEIRGLDMSEEAAAIAQGEGLDVEVGSYSEVSGEYDLIYAVAVLEHVPGPGHFLETLGSRLAPDGVLLLGQPCQDNGSSDIFFVDHIHHFCSNHVEAFASNAGLSESARLVGEEPVESFSLHALQPESARAPTRPQVAPCVHALEAEVARWTEIFARVDSWLESRSEADLVVWGTGQTFTLLSAYTRLGRREISLGLDQNAARFESSTLAFPIVDPREIDGVVPGNSAVLFTFEPSTDQADRLEELGIDFLAPFQV